MDVVDVLRAARNAVDEAAIPDDLRNAAFVKAVELLSNSSLQRPFHQVAGESNGKSAGRSLEVIGQRIGVAPADLENVYDVQPDALTVIVPRARFPQQKGPATRMFALILAAGRQAAGYDDGWTSTETIRQMCSDFGIFDSGHFAQTILDMDDVLVVRGKGLSREVKVTQGGYEEAARQIQRLSQREPL